MEQQTQNSQPLVTASLKQGEDQLRIAKPDLQENNSTGYLPNEI
ncbi:hypothetical protein [Sunxiuqinia elliptica]|uniref:Uncharacterized protein n=1 Tax=Sunxiuqinia elliptica TaxID=655355 RepID=A0A4R6GT48_9BACT|nr:hypothetical protein [Sunxiuqinia elliptica]TDN97814.1 hypothetical protein DET52_109218 [Sunxiuqinia elliptica]TDO55892.1 hypothetical protein DET65_4433 [Sunxiuqinia elliptica]